MTKEKKQRYYKVVTKDMKSLGLRNNPNIMTFEVGIPVEEPRELKRTKVDDGGIWCVAHLGKANVIRRYMKNQHDVDCRIFECEIGEILYYNPYRLKTDVVTLIEEVFDVTEYRRQKEKEDKEEAENKESDE